jgi:predicted metalloprotease
MRLDDREESKNVDDRRGMGRKAGLAIGGGGAGVLILIVVCLALGVDPQQFLGGGVPGNGNDPGVQAPPDPEEEEMRHFTAVVFGDTERVWRKQFSEKLHKEYQEPTLVLFSGQVDTACGAADAGVGPFYCPGDSKVYIDLSFYRELDRKLGAGGKFARAYVVAHEVGHHVQRLLGYSTDLRPRGETEKQGSVRLELQADYLAGVWAHHGQKEFNFLEKGDIESALNAAHQIGDDQLMKRAGRRVMPENFTHGTSAQRMRWLNEGLKTGEVKGAAALFKLPYNEL